MYRIEVSPGEEAVFRTIEELATAIRNGLVSPRSRIYHSASQKWLPIEFHPHYKKALHTLDRPRPTPAPSSASGNAAAPAPVRSPEPAPAPAAVAVAEPRRSAAPAGIAAHSIPAAAASLPFIEIELPPMAYPLSLAAASALNQSYGSHGSQLPVARRRTAGSRPLLYAGGAVLLVVVGYLVTSAAPSGDMAAKTVPGVSVPAAVEAPPVTVKAERPTSEAELERVSMPELKPEPPPEPARITAPTPARTAAPTPARAIISAPPRSGPPSQAWSSSAGATTPLRVAGPAAPSEPVPAPAIAPAPAAMKLPSLRVADSLAPKAGSLRDTTAIKRILKAVTGAKPSEENPPR